MKKLISLLLVAIMLVCALPASAEDSEEKYTVTVDGVAYEYAAGETVLIREPVFEAAPAMRSTEGASKMYKFNGFTVEGASVENTDKRLIELVVPENDVTITTNRILHGDVTGDDKTNALDVFEIRSLMVNNVETSYQAEFDVYPDGKVNPKDVLALRKSIAGMFEYEAYEDYPGGLSEEIEKKFIQCYVDFFNANGVEISVEETSIEIYLGTYRSEKYGDVIVAQFNGLGGFALTSLIINGIELVFPTTWTPFAYRIDTDELVFLANHMNTEKDDEYNTIYQTDMFSVDDAYEMLIRYKNRKKEWYGIDIY